MNIIETFRKIEETGELPPGFCWRRIHYEQGQGWRGYVAGPAGATSWLSVKRIPRELLAGVEIG